MSTMQSKREAHRDYARAIEMWCGGYDTAEIATMCGVSEAVAARWVANYRDLMVGGEAA